MKFQTCNQRNVCILSIVWIITFFISCSFITNTKNLLIDNQKKVIIASTEILYSHIDDDYISFKNGIITEEEAKRRTITFVQRLRYGDIGYFWIMDSKSNLIVHGQDPSLSNRNIFNIEDKFGNNISTKMKEIAFSKTGEGFITYFWPHPHRKFGEELPKISYIKYFKPWDWIIGTGFYVDDIKITLYQSLVVLFGGIITVLLVITVIFMLRSEHHV